MTGLARGVIAIDIGGTKIDVALAGPDGAVHDRQRLPTRAGDGPRQAIARIGSTARDLGAGASRFGLTVAGAAAVSPGVVHDGGLQLVPTMPGWDDYPLAQEIGAELGFSDVPVWNDVHAAGLAEARSGALVDADPGLYVNLGTGVSAAIVVGGTVLRGAHRAAGEIGYLTPHESALTPVGTAPLEEIVGGGLLGPRIGALTGRALTSADVLASTDPVVQGLVHQAVLTLAREIANIAVTLDPAVVAIGGGMTAAAGLILPVVEAEVRRRVPFPPAVVLASYRTDAALHGAVALALGAVDRIPAAS
ncbi:glucokinase [Paraoerskovia marina]|uniref:Glucokinase n=1 Tax=Paraoerskovia marina TaxID=545619 RepID=A0A1H1PAT4_9CELL|nr:ROK family protein [Paraoerskovia marina]SDS08408.1 glucokinase [Paraoerskovia marina]